MDKIIHNYTKKLTQETYWMDQIIHNYTKKLYTKNVLDGSNNPQLHKKALHEKCIG